MYKSLKYIPYVIFFEILESSNFHLLSKEEKEFEDFTDSELEEFVTVWEKIYKESISLDPTSEYDKILKIEREVSHFKAKYKYIKIACQCLRFDYDQELFDEINAFGYGLKDDENYYSHLERIEREAEGLLVKSERFASQLPKIDEQEPTKKVSPYDILGSYSAILGIALNFNKVTYLEAKAYELQVSNKIKAALKNTDKK